MQAVCKVAHSVASKMLETVPNCPKAEYSDAIKLMDFIRKSKRMVVLSGAGVSTESGIRDYRSLNIGQYAIMKRQMLTYQEFQKSEVARKRFWLRNFVSWPSFSSAQPNSTHLALANWERKGFVANLVTQNIDGLHTKARSRRVVELHGSMNKVKCLKCNKVIIREEMQKKIRELNSSWIEDVEPSKRVAVDGDVLVMSEELEKFEVPKCPCCRGILKSDVVFFGEEIPTDVEDKVSGMIDEADAILVIGSSLHVYSGYRYVYQANRSNKKVAIINSGSTNADDLADLRIFAKCGDIISYLEHLEEAYL